MVRNCQVTFIVYCFTLSLTMYLEFLFPMLGIVRWYSSFTQSSGCVVESHCGVMVRSPDVIFPLLIYWHLYLCFGKLWIQWWCMYFDWSVFLLLITEVTYSAFSPFLDIYVAHSFTSLIACLLWWRTECFNVDGSHSIVFFPLWVVL